MMLVATDVGNHGAGRVEQFASQCCSPRGGVPGNVFFTPEKSFLWVVYGLSTVCLRPPPFSEVDIGENSKALFFGMLLVCLKLGLK